MVKLKGPSLSLNAAGSIGGALTFSNWKGRAYAKKLTTPTNPKSQPQVAARAMMRFLATNFGTLSAANILTWADLAQQNNISTYNAWLAYNMDRWARFLAPTKAFPATEALDAMEINSIDATALNRSIIVDINRAEPFDDWGIMIFRVLHVTIPRTLEKCIRVLLWEEPFGEDLSYKDGPLEPDTYYYKLISFSTDGKTDTSFVSSANATIT